MTTEKVLIDKVALQNFLEGMSYFVADSHNGAEAFVLEHAAIIKTVEESGVVVPYSFLIAKKENPSGQDAPAA